eukprot:TRINITY_DN32199_c0_g1_i3.p1 TRINITY_DN32199_c0_g1~~TRINITY_DN32199_c0_g1_i3.p1  ORF type:complete len:384 (-),score=81.45 TRINITY_DN32199_c0_g1_i3:84-1148(-)
MAGHTAHFASMLERRTQKLSQADEKQKDDEVYLESYAELDIHEDMLKDGPRVESYRQAIEHYKPEWTKRGDVSVVDVGSGTGLLAIFSARAGACRVVAVEASRLAFFLRQIVEANVPNGTVEVQECLAEDLKLPEGEAVDVIVSEWMGYFLLYENMLPSVLSVRDRYLKPGGLMLPSRSRLLAAPIEDKTWRESKIDYWNSVHGIDMSMLVPLANATACERPQHRCVSADGILAEPVELFNLDLHTVKDADLQRFEAELNFDIPAGRRVDGVTTWFECEFGAAGWLLSTSPKDSPTHWKQTTFYFKQPLEGGGGIRIEGSVVIERHETFSRGYRVNFNIGAPGRKRRDESFELR